MSNSLLPVLIECEYCKQAVSNDNFLSIVEKNSPTNFFDWKTTICFYCALHYMKSFAATKNVDLENHNDFDIKTFSQSTGASPELIVDSQIRSFYINLRKASNHSRYDGLLLNAKVAKKVAKLRYKDSLQYLEKIKNWVVPELQKANIEINYDL